MYGGLEGVESGGGDLAMGGSGSGGRGSSSGGGVRRRRRGLLARLGSFCAGLVARRSGSPAVGELWVQMDPMPRAASGEAQPRARPTSSSIPVPVSGHPFTYFVEEADPGYHSFSSASSCSLQSLPALSP